jgi:2-polyprenyl-3-methyl-5-hydroxy-6-metoxy-1,4-benzoquinol methylase
MGKRIPWIHKIRRNMKILVFGGSGTLGKELQKINPSLICPSHDEVDITDDMVVEACIKREKPDVVVNAAAVIDNRILEKFPEVAIRTNIIGAANIAKACIENNIRLVYISTDYVYKGDRGNYLETDELLPFNFYAWTKIGGEASTIGVKNHLIIRVSFGKSIFSYPVSFVDKWSSKDYVDVIAPMIYDAIISPLTGVVNLGTERKTIFSHAKERNDQVKPVKLAETSFFTPYDTSLNTQRWMDYTSEKSICVPNTSCRACGSGKLTKYLDLGPMPLSNNLENTSLNAKLAERFPLQILICEDCALSQLSVIVDPGKMFSNYVYRSSVNKPYVEHCRKMAKTLKEKYSLDESCFHIDIAGNDGTLLKEFKEEIGLKVLNVDPASNLAAIAESQGIPTIADFWSADVSTEILEKYGKADLITATNVFAHVDNIFDFLFDIKLTLKDKGVAVIECPYIIENMKVLAYNQTYFEHLSYISLSPIEKLCKLLSLEIIDAEKQDIHGGSIRITVANERKYIPFKNVAYLLNQEEIEGWTSSKKYQNWAQEVYNNIHSVTEAILKLKKEGASIVGIAASAKGNTLLNCMGLSTDIVDVIIDETSEKIGKFSPGTGIPIVHKRYFQKNSPDYCIILAENFAEPLMKKAREAGFKGKFIISLPKFKIIE